MQIKAYRQRWFWRVGLLWLVGLAASGVQAQVGAWRYHFAATPTKQLASCGQDMYAAR